MMTVLQKDPLKKTTPIAPPSDYTAAALEQEKQFTQQSTVMDTPPMPGPNDPLDNSGRTAETGGPLGPVAKTTPGLPDGAAPGLPQPAPMPTPGAGKELFEGASEVQPNETVQGQLTELFSNKDVNPLFDYARGQATQYANSRGLVNSSMAAGAGEEAVMAQAFVIASQDANTFAARAQALQKQGFDTALMEQDFGLRSNLMHQELQNALAMSDQDNTQMLERMDLAHTQTLEQIEATAVVNENQREADFGRQLQLQYLVGAENRTAQFSVEVQTIYQTEGLTPAQQANAVNVARRNYENDTAMMQDFYTSSPSWNPDWGIGGSSGLTEGPQVGINNPNPPTIPGNTTIPGTSPGGPGGPPSIVGPTNNYNERGYYD